MIWSTSFWTRGSSTKDCYFDVFVEYAKAAPEDILIRTTVCNRGPAPATVHLLPTLWFRNTWSWAAGGSKPVLRPLEGARHTALLAHHTDPLFQESLQDYVLARDGEPALLFTENETNSQRLFGTPNPAPYVKDGIHNCLVHGQSGVVRPRLSGASTVPKGSPFGEGFDEVFAARLREADEFYASVTPPSVGADEARVMREALAGVLWSKQYYYFDADKWLEEHQAHPLHGHTRQVRNREWFHMVNDHVISMPDKWEYPWYAAWDLAFHAIALSVVDTDFAKEQLDLMLREIYLHPSGQIPAYEWNYSDVNPPVHAWATLFLYAADYGIRGVGDINFLKLSFAKLMPNFTWWVNRKDRFGKNVFEGGFLGLDNIGVFDRSAPLPTGGHLEQADGTGWVALFCQNMIEMSIELAAHDPAFEDLCYKFVEHFLWIASGMNREGTDGMWDEEDGFYYDLLRFPDGSSQRLKVRSVVGLLPVCATTVVEDWQKERVPRVVENFRARMVRMPELLQSIHPVGSGHEGVANRRVLALVNEERLRRILSRMLDKNEFLGPYGIRALSRHHLEHPFVFRVHGEDFRVHYLPAESDSGMFGGNSNWRGPVWMPVNALIIRGLLEYYLYYGDAFRIECPTGSGRMMNLFEVSKEIAGRLTRIFLRDQRGRRPVFGGTEKFQTDPHWRDYLLFYEYFHGDDGAGLGASHQTGWTGLVAKLIDFGRLNPAEYLAAGKLRAFSGLENP